MVKEFSVKYGKDTYTRNALTGAPLQYLGLRLMPKVLSLGATIGAMINRQYVQGENHLSYVQSIESIFNADDWKWLVEELIYNPENPIKVNNNYLTTEMDIDNHFAGDFVRLYTVTLQLAYQNLGEWKTLTESVSGLAKNISDYLKNVLESHLTDLEQSFNTYANNKKQAKKTGKSQNKA